MAYQLPNGKIITLPRRNRFFLLPTTGQTRHPEYNLISWDKQGVLGDYGIVVVLEQVEIPDAPTLADVKKYARQMCKQAAIDFLHGNFDAFDRTLLAQVYARNSLKRAMIGEVYDWEQGIIDALFDTIDGINAAADEDAVLAIVYDFSVWNGTKPPHTLKQMLRT